MKNEKKTWQWKLWQNWQIDFLKPKIKNWIINLWIFYENEILTMFPFVCKIHIFFTFGRKILSHSQEKSQMKILWNYKKIINQILETRIRPVLRRFKALKLFKALNKAMR